MSGEGRGRATLPAPAPPALKLATGAVMEQLKRVRRAFTAAEVALATMEKFPEEVGPQQWHALKVAIELCNAIAQEQLQEASRKVIAEGGVAP